MGYDAFFNSHPYYHEDAISTTHNFYMNRYNKRHLYIQTNTANNAIFRIGDYQTINVPPRQWVYWPYPETSIIQMLLPTFTITLSSFATDEVISALGRYGEGYNDYARAEQAFSANLSAAPAVIGHFAAIEVFAPVTCTSNIILDRVQIDASPGAMPSPIFLTQSTTHDTNISNILSYANHRTDAAAHSITPQVQLFAITDSTSFPAGTISLQIAPGVNSLELLNGLIREIPKFSQGAIGIYCKSTSNTAFFSINLSYHEELA